jgi:hypothetical protein
MTNSSTTWTNEVYRSSYGHGRFAISRFEECGYALAILPSDTVVESQIEFTSPHGTSQVMISSSYSIAKSLLAIFQFSYAVFTLIRSTQSEIGFYGYVSFSSSILPYAIMSLVNLVVNMLCPHYPILYMVRNSVMDEAEQRLGMRFEGTVGQTRRLPSPSTTNSTPYFLQNNDKKPENQVDLQYVDQVARRLIKDLTWSGTTSFEQLFRLGISYREIKGRLEQLPSRESIRPRPVKILST